MTKQNKTEATRFQITWTEAQHAGRMTADTWEDFDAILGEIAEIAPSGGAYHKTGFEITFEDGETYTGRYDVQNIGHAGSPDLRDHVRRFVGYHSGLIRPDHLTETDYAAHLKMYGEDTRQTWYELARRYAVGVETPDDGPADPGPDPLRAELAGEPDLFAYMAAEAEERDHNEERAEIEAREIDRRMVRALNAMETAMSELEELRRMAGDRGPKLAKGEAELNKAYAIVSAKRPSL